MENSRLHSRNNDGLPVQYDEDENDDLDSSVETKISQEFSNLGKGSHFVEYKREQEIAKDVKGIWWRPEPSHDEGGVQSWHSGHGPHLL